VVYTIQLPGSAMPGWPAEVPLPADPLWMSQFAALKHIGRADGVARKICPISQRASGVVLRIQSAYKLGSLKD
jgi:hypothetical protein